MFRWVKDKGLLHGMRKMSRGNVQWQHLRRHHVVVRCWRAQLRALVVHRWQHQVANRFQWAHHSTLWWFVQTKNCCCCCYWYSLLFETHAFVAFGVKPCSLRAYRLLIFVLRFSNAYLFVKVRVSSVTICQNMTYMNYLVIICCILRKNSCEFFKKDCSRWQEALCCCAPLDTHCFF